MRTVRQIHSLPETIDWSKLDSPSWSLLPKTPTYIETTLDVLAISHSLHRVYEDTGTWDQRWQALDDPGASKLVTGLDHEMANKIRNYFSSQLLLSQLRGDTVTQFQQQLVSIVEGPSKKFSDQNRGIYYRLPEYYYYSLEFDGMVEKNFNNVTVRELIQPQHQFELTPIERFKKRSRTDKCSELWFKNSQTSEPVRLSVDLANPLGYIVDQFFDLGKTMQVRGKFSTKTRQGFQYIAAKDHSWQITNLKDFI
jgi:hypothetical protein